MVTKGAMVDYVYSGCIGNEWSKSTWVEWVLPDYISDIYDTSIRCDNFFDENDLVMRINLLWYDNNILLSFLWKFSCWCVVYENYFEILRWAQVKGGDGWWKMAPVILKLLLCPLASGSAKMDFLHMAKQLDRTSRHRQQTNQQQCVWISCTHSMEEWGCTGRWEWGREKIFSYWMQSRHCNSLEGKIIDLKLENWGCWLAGAKHMSITWVVVIVWMIPHNWYNAFIALGIIVTSVKGTLEVWQCHDLDWCGPIGPVRGYHNIP